jgi:hypothetical protein
MRSARFRSLMIWKGAEAYRAPGYRRLLSIFEKLPSFRDLTTVNTDKHGQVDDFKPVVRVFRVGQCLNFFKFMMAL